MTNSFLPTIVIVDDNFPDHDPLAVRLRTIYGDSNVIVINRPRIAIDYILNSVRGKVIVLLDIDLGRDEPNGVEVLEIIRQTTSLIYVLVITATPVNQVNPSLLVKLVNNDAMAILSKTTSTTEILSLINKATHKLECRVDSAIEQWILKQPQFNSDEPYIMSRSGQTYSLKEVLNEIRRETEFGKYLERSIINLTIDLLTRRSEQIDD